MAIDSAYLPAIAALVGSAIGGFTSLATTWLTQHGQAKLQQMTRDRVKRETLFAQFIDEASMLYADAFTHDGTDLAKLAKMYSMISRMRLLSSKNIVEHAELVSHKIVETYLAPNKTFDDVLELRENGELDPLKQFSEACREELRQFNRHPL
jgi:hypothetical protein